MYVHRLASQWKSLQNDRNSLQQFQTAVEDFVGRLVAMETSLTSLAEETARPGVQDNAELGKELLDQFHVSPTVPALLPRSPPSSSLFCLLAPLALLPSSVCWLLFLLLVPLAVLPFSISSPLCSSPFC